MLLGPAVALILAAAAPAAADEACQNQQQSDGDIVICAERQQGYRLNPDVMEARRELKSGRLKPPQTYKQQDCSTVGPMGCRGGPALDVVGAAMAAVLLAEKAARGENIGKTFVTDPHPDEYQLYLDAKRRREARAAEEKAAALDKAEAKAPPAPPVAD